MSEMPCTVARLTPDDEAIIREAVSTYTFAEYRAYRMLGKGISQEVVMRRLRRRLREAPPAGVYAARQGCRIAGIAGITPFPWGATCFGVSMAQIEDIIVSPAQSPEVYAELISVLGNTCRTHGVVHLSCKVDSECLPAIHALEDYGYRLMGMSVTYLFNRQRHQLRQVKPYCRIRRFKPDDLGTIIKMAQGQFTHSRFSRDGHFSSAQIDCFYRTWIQNICSSDERNVSYVAERGGTLVGFFLAQKDDELSDMCGRALYNNGLSGVQTRGRGVYPALLIATMHDSRLELAEFETQGDNRPVLAVWQRLGLDLMRCRQVFHCWL